MACLISRYRRSYRSPRLKLQPANTMTLEAIFSRAILLLSLRDYLGSKGRNSRMNYIGDLDAPLLQISERDRFTLRDACQGVHVFGGIGSGKTSGSGQAIAAAYLRAGFGGLVLCAKPEEADAWIRYAKKHGRANSLLLFGERGGGGFNFITYELARQGADGTGSVVECLMRILEAARLSNPSAGRSSDSFWEDATRQALRNTIPILYAATGAVRIPEIIRFV